MSVNPDPAIYAKPPLRANEGPDEGVRSFFRFVIDHRWLLLILAANLPLILVHFAQLWRKPEYQFFPLVFATVAYLIWSRAEPYPTGTHGPRHRPLAYALLVVALLISVAANFLVYSPWLGMISFVLAAGAVFLLISESFYICNLFGVWIMLWLLVPVPMQYGDRISRALQRFTTSVSSSVLETIGIPNIAEGTVLSLASKQLFVEEACSGIVSMMSILACGLIIAAIANRSLLHSFLLVVSGLAWAATTNILRIVTLGYAQEQMGLDLTEGWRHDVLGLVLFGIAVLFVLSTDRLLTFLIGPSKDEEFRQSWSSWSVLVWEKLTTFGIPQPVERVAQTPSLAEVPDETRTFRSARILTLLGISFLLVGVGSTAVAVERMVKKGTDEQRMSAGTLPFVQGLREDSVPEMVGEWQRRTFSAGHSERLFAQDSRVWSYGRGGLNGVFAMDFSFDSWHNLCVCYQMVGWTQKEDYRVISPDTDGGILIEADFEKDSGQKGYLIYSLVEFDGRPYEPAEIIAEHRSERYQPPTSFERLLGRVRHEVELDDKHLFQFQLWVTAPREITRSERQAARELFETLRSQLQRQLNVSMQSLTPSNGSSTGAADTAGHANPIIPLMVELR
jgi:exosortase